MSERLVCVAVFPDTASANIARTRLEAERIPACVSGKAASDVLWPMNQAFGGVKRLVREDQLVAAADVLEAADGGKHACEAHRAHAAGDDEQDGEAPSGLRSDDEERDAEIRRAWYAAVMGVLCIGLPLLSLYSMYLLVSRGLLTKAPGRKSDWRATAAPALHLFVLAFTSLYWVSLCILPVVE